jgi:hypothetical protein
MADNEHSNLGSIVKSSAAPKYSYASEAGSNLWSIVESYTAPRYWDCGNVRINSSEQLANYSAAVGQIPSVLVPMGLRESPNNSRTVRQADVRQLPRASSVRIVQNGSDFPATSLLCV